MRASLAAIAAVLALATPAQAASVAVEDGVLHYESAGSESYALAIFRPPPGPPPPGSEGTDHEHFWIDAFAAVTAGPGCDRADSADRPDRFRCDAAGVESVLVELGPGSDSASVRTELPVRLLGREGSDFFLQAPMHGEVDGGPGNDEIFVFAPVDPTIRGGAGIDTVTFHGESSSDNGPVRVSLDGQPGDGEPGAQINVMPDVEKVQGTPRADVITGSDGPNTLDAALDSDTLDGAGGDDWIEAVDLFVSPDHHYPSDYRPTRDTIACGPGRDNVRADQEDVFTDDCERVTVFRVVEVRVDDYHWSHEEQLRAAVTILNGSEEGERLVGAPDVANRVVAGGGGDVVLGGRRADLLLGGAGADSIRPGGGRDRVSGGSGRDAVSARGGGRDSIRCGSGRDRVLADRRDRVARDCELVQRSRR